MANPAARLAHSVSNSIQTSDGETIADLLSLKKPSAHQLVQSLPPGWPDAVNKILNKRQPWGEVVCNHIEALLYSGKTPSTLDFEAAQAAQSQTVQAYEAQTRVAAALIRWLQASSGQRWAVPILLTVLHDLRELALAADAYLASVGSKPNKLEEMASRHLMKAFSTCLSDRGGSLQASRRWGTYAVANLLFKTYFKLRALALCKNIKRAIESSGDLPALEQFPVADQVGYRYHIGVYAFLNEEYALAESHLDFTFEKCPMSALFITNQELILSYLIPLKLMRGILPSSSLLDYSARLRQIYEPLTEAVKTGDVRRYDQLLLWAEKRLLERGTYLAVENARVICLRTLLRRIWLTQQKQGEAPNTRLDLDLFQRGLAFVGMEIDMDEVECIMANMIFKGYVKGYMSHGQQKIVFSAKQPFPPLSAVNPYSRI